MNRLMLATGAAAVALMLAGPAAVPEAWAQAKETIVIDLVNEPSSLDPHMQWNPDSYYVYRNIFDNMVTRDDDGEIIPQVATSWEYLSDTEVAFTIRDDITFHDGAPLTAEDVAFSVNRIINPDFSSPQLGQFNKITGAEATDDTTVVITTDGPYPVLLAQLVKLSIVPRHYVEEVGDEQFNLAPMGSGPYAFDTWQRGVQVTLVRNDAYWGDMGPFERAEFRAVPDAATRVANLQAGESDLVVSLNQDLATQIEGDPAVKPLIVNTERVAFLRLNTQIPPTDDPRVREAIAHAIDKEGLTVGLLGGYPEPVDIMLSPAHFGWVEGIEGPDYDPDAAHALLEEVGDASEVEMVFATAPVFDQRIVQALQQMLADVGLSASIEMTDMSTYLGRVRSDPGDAPHMNFGRWSCACQDADGVLFPLLHSSSSWSVVRDPDLDADLEAARNTLDDEERLEHYLAVHEAMIEETLLVPLYQAAIIYGAAEALDWQPTANESLFLNRMDWTE